MNASIKYGRRKNLGNYEHEDLEIMIAVEDSQKASLHREVTDLRSFVHECLFNTPVVAPEVKVKMEKLDKAAEKIKKEEVKKVEEPKKEIATQDEVAKHEPKPLEVKKDSIVEAKSEVIAPVEVEAPKEEKTAEKVEAKVEKKTAVKKETKTVVKKTQVTAYDRNLDAHKNNLGVFLDSTFKTWRKPENLKKAGVASRELQGKDFLDAEGNILESFKEAFSAYMVELV